MQYILVGCPDTTVCAQLQEHLSQDYVVETAATAQECLVKYKKRKYDITFLDITLIKSGDNPFDANSYRQALQEFWQAFPSSQIVILASQEDTRAAVAAVKAGAVNYLNYPLDPVEVKFIVDDIYSSLIQESELNYLRDKVLHDEFLEMTRTASPVMNAVMEKVKSVAPTRTTVLLTGETGTGKGVIAQLIHRYSNRYEKQFISVHCGAIPDTLIESELFGHEKGSFTGAVRRKLGKFEIAMGGTLFLDEIGTVTPAVQIKLLQVLQDKVFQRVGGEENIETDVRVIAATNEDLGRLCEQEKFRRDLFYRLSVFPIEIPPLRQRREDLAPLVETFLKNLNKVHLKRVNGIHPLVMEAFENYSWPGNIRELENLVERAYILETSPILTPESFPMEMFDQNTAAAPVNFDTSLSLAQVRKKGIENIERSYLKELLAAHKGKINAVALAAGISTRQLHKLLTKYGIRKEEFKTISAK